VIKLGAALLEVGALSPAALDRALEVQRSAGGRLGTVLLEQGLISEETLARALSKVTGREYAHWTAVREAPKDVLALVPAKIALRALAVPFLREGRVLKVAMRDPNDLATEDELSFVTGKKVETCVIAEFRLAEALERFYGKQRTARFHLLADKIDRGLLKPGSLAPRTAPPPPPPPSFTAPSTPARPSSENRYSDVWKTRQPGREEEIEISTWKPETRAMPFVTPAPVATSVELEYTPEDKEIPAEAVAAEPISIAEASDRIRHAESRNEIGDAALACLERDFPLVALFIARKDDAIGWRIAGEGVSHSEFQSLRIPFSEPSLFLNVRISMVFYQGTLPSLPAHEPLLLALGRRPERCALFPVVLKKRVVAFVLVEPKNPVLAPEQVATLQGLTAAMADGFAALIMSQRSRKERA
jgi:hypothetical protein